MKKNIFLLSLLGFVSLPLIPQAFAEAEPSTAPPPIPQAPPPRLLKAPAAISMEAPSRDSSADALHVIGNLMLGRLQTLEVGSQLRGHIADMRKGNIQSSRLNLDLGVKGSIANGRELFGAPVGGFRESGSNTGVNPEGRFSGPNLLPFDIRITSDQTALISIAAWEWSNMIQFTHSAFGRGDSDVRSDWDFFDSVRLFHFVHDDQYGIQGLTQNRLSVAELTAKTNFYDGGNQLLNATFLLNPVSLTYNRFHEGPLSQKHLYSPWTMAPHQNDGKPRRGENRYDMALSGNERREPDLYQFQAGYGLEFMSETPSGVRFTAALKFEHILQQMGHHHTEAEKALMQSRVDLYNTTSAAYQTAVENFQTRKAQWLAAQTELTEISDADYAKEAKDSVPTAASIIKDERARIEAGRPVWRQMFFFRPHVEIRKRLTRTNSPTAPVFVGAKITGDIPLQDRVKLRGEPAYDLSNDRRTLLRIGAYLAF